LQRSQRPNSGGGGRLKGSGVFGHGIELMISDRLGRVWLSLASRLSASVSGISKEELAGEQRSQTICSVGWEGIAMC
jgi:hypothetical protein